MLTGLMVEALGEDRGVLMGTSCRCRILRTAPASPRVPPGRRSRSLAVLRRAGRRLRSR